MALSIRGFTRGMGGGGGPMIPPGLGDAAVDTVQGLGGPVKAAGAAGVALAGEAVDETVDFVKDLF